jgi:hypothetical protein
MPLFCGIGNRGFGLRAAHVVTGVNVAAAAVAVARKVRRDIFPPGRELEDFMFCKHVCYSLP